MSIGQGFDPAAQLGAGAPLEIEWCPDTSLSFLPDHFPGKPIVPAYYQLAYVRGVISSSLAVDPARVNFKAIKFLAPIAPGVRVRVRVEPKRSHSSFGVMLSVDDKVVSQGDITLE